MSDSVVVLLFATMTALATGLGALPLAFKRMTSAIWIGRGDALAVGFMLGASVALLHEGGTVGGLQTTLGALIGASVVLAAKWASPSHELPDGDASSKQLSVTTLLVSVMAIHSAAEGIGVGVAFAGGAELGLVIAIAIAIHNIPEGLAISLVAVPRGASVPRAAWLSVMSSLPQPLLAVPAFLLVEQFDQLLPWGFGIAAGAMIAMAFAWLAPDALEELSLVPFTVIAACGLVAMVAGQALLL